MLLILLNYTVLIIYLFMGFHAYNTNPREKLNRLFWRYVYHLPILASSWDDQAPQALPTSICDQWQLRLNTPDCC